MPSPRPSPPAPLHGCPLRRYRDAHCRRLPAKRRGRLCRKDPRRHPQPVRRVPPRTTLCWQNFAVPTLIVPTPPTCWPCGMGGRAGSCARLRPRHPLHQAAGAGAFTTTPHPWSAALAGKRVLVVHPFKNNDRAPICTPCRAVPRHRYFTAVCRPAHRAGRAGTWPGRHRLRQLV